MIDKNGEVEVRVNSLLGKEIASKVLGIVEEMMLVPALVNLALGMRLTLVLAYRALAMECSWEMDYPQRIPA